MTIIWSKKAGDTFQKNIDYLLENWPEIESKKFVARVFEYIDLLAKPPFIARKTYKTKLRCLPVPHFLIWHYR